ncbi:FAD binding domain-containing protein [Solicola gregarius]|uniref:FAD binding domain-containing protein n=1 Tax=Solicola gregarius TaxID=2908642 RepID=A0AA46TJS8_9ACTN|nr:FAD binding domain-containing protein [Solicola gregarius]UYM06576.1 FAD binding domain-containing protein [Solicola gregarius]
MITLVHRPRTVQDAVAALADGGTILAGGTHVMPDLNTHASPDTELVSLRDAELRGVDVDETTTAIGAGTTLAGIAAEPRLSYLAPVIGSIAAPPVRTLATIAGNCFVPQPYGDLAVALVALDAEVDTVGPAGPRTQPLRTVVVDGLETAEIVTRIRFRTPAPGALRFHKATRRRQNSASIVTIAAHVTESADVVSDIRIAVGAMAPTIVRAEPAEQLLVGKRLEAGHVHDAAEAAMPELTPASDSYASSWYRTRVFPTHLRRALLGH